MADKTKIAYNGIGFSGILTIVFIILKLIGKIDWSWIWVLSPLWIPFAFTVGIFLIVALASLIVNVFG